MSEQPLHFGPGPLPEGVEKEFETQSIIMPSEPVYDEIIQVMAKHGVLHPKSHKWILSKEGNNLYLMDRYNLKPGEAPTPSSDPIPGSQASEKIVMNDSQVPAGANPPEMGESVEQPPIKRGKYGLG